MEDVLFAHHFPKVYETMLKPDERRALFEYARRWRVRPRHRNTRQSLAFRESSEVGPSVRLLERNPAGQ